MFNITPQNLQVIFAALNELPHKVSRPVIDDLMMQAEALDKAAQQSAAEPAPKRGRPPKSAQQPAAATEASAES